MRPGFRVKSLEQSRRRAEASVFTNPLTTGWLGTRHPLRWLPHTWVSSLERASGRLPLASKEKLMTHVGVRFRAAAHAPIGSDATVQSPLHCRAPQGSDARVHVGNAGDRISDSGAYAPLVPEELTCSVVVPSYRRHESLRRCLSALLDQEAVPDEIVVVARVDDVDTQAVVAEIQRETERVSLASVDRPGVIAAMEAGVRQAGGDLIAFTDDDARPRPDWLSQLTAAFQDDNPIAGVGGRDNVGSEGSVNDRRTVGHLAWFGRLAGNHHRGVGPRRAVTVLKGVNCAYRRDVLQEIGFDHRLRGCGVQLHWELALGLEMVRRGWLLLYDPAIMVDHDEAPRLGGQRLAASHVEKQSVADAAYNEALLLNEHLSGLRKFVYLVWSSVVGHRDSPGVVQAVRFTPTLGGHSWRRWSAASRARREARRAGTR